MKSKTEICSCQRNPSREERIMVRARLDEIYSNCLNLKTDLDIFDVRFIVRYLAETRSLNALPCYRRDDLEPSVIRKLIRAMMTYEDIIAICGCTQRVVENEEAKMIEATPREFPFNI